MALTMTKYESTASRPFGVIAADKVQGTSVYDTAGNKLGTIEYIMLDKTSGRVAYAVLSFGGFLGIGEKYHPLPWDVLHYDLGKGGYVIKLTRAHLEQAPTIDGRDSVDWEKIDWENAAWGERVYRHYGVPPYWIGPM